MVTDVFIFNISQISLQSIMMKYSCRKTLVKKRGKQLYTLTWPSTGATHQHMEDSRDADLKCGLKGAFRITVPEGELGSASVQIFQVGSL